MPDRHTDGRPEGATAVRTGADEPLDASLFYMHTGSLAFLLGLSGMGVFEWSSVLVGWGGAAFILGILKMFERGSE